MVEPNRPTALKTRAIRQAQQGAQSAGRAFAAMNDAIGQRDVHWVEASIALDQGALQQVGGSLRQANESYRLAGDAKRVELCEARDLIFLASYHAALDSGQIRHALIAADAAKK